MGERQLLQFPRSLCGIHSQQPAGTYTLYGKKPTFMDHLIDYSIVALARIYVMSLPSSPWVICTLLTGNTDEFIYFFLNLAFLVAPTLQNATFKLSVFYERKPSVLCLSKTRVLGKNRRKEGFHVLPGDWSSIMVSNHSAVGEVVGVDSGDPGIRRQAGGRRAKKRRGRAPLNL